MIINFDSAYSDEVGATHRKQFGQFFTDSRVASFMVKWVLLSGQPSVYDPAFGLGAFYTAIGETNEISFVASEIDSHILNFWRKYHRDVKLEIRQEDYLKTWGLMYANIVCNPPYMRFQKFFGREQIFREFEKRLGVRISGYTNTASAFLLKSLSELKQGGRLAYIMPLEFLNAGYGTLIKEKLIEKSWLRAIISFNCEKEVFPDVTTSVGIVLVDSASESSHVEFHVVNNIRELGECLEKKPNKKIPTAMLLPSEKWLQHFQPRSVECNRSCLVPLYYYGRFSRGIATGANEFFTASESRFNALGIGDDEVVACITKSSQITRPFFSQSDFGTLKSADAKVLLFSPNGSASAGAREYIRSGENAGYHKRFLTKNRTPWYKTEVRSPSPLLLGVFSRGGYKIIKNESDALSLTCYHGFQPNLFGMSYIDSLFLYLLSDAGRQLLSLSMRKYGDSLDKFEPNDLNTALVPTLEIFDMISRRDIQEAIEIIREGGAIPEAIQRSFNEIFNAQHNS